MSRAKNCDIMKTKQFKWKLRRSSRKEICPRCGQRRFVPYVLTEDGETIAGAEFGRCDREQSCGYHRYPDGEVKTTIEVQPQRRADMLRYNGDLCFGKSTLFNYAVKLLGYNDAILAWSEYRIGNVGGRTIWWQIDANGVVRTGKIMAYKQDGHRDKANAHGVTWAHKHEAFRDMFTGEELKQCLFGEHLLAQRPNAGVVLVESEKTAVMLSRFIPQYVWLATGGSQGIKNEERLKVLEGRKVVLIPDSGMYLSWLRVAEKLSWAISDIAETECLFDGCDILDIVEHEKTKHL